MSLAAENVRLAFWYGRKYQARDREDVAAAALLGLVLAEREHDPARGAFKALAGLRCKRHALEEVYRQRRCADREVSLSSFDSAGEEHERHELPHAPPVDGHGLMAEKLRAAVAELPEREAEIIRRRFGLEAEPETLAAIGAGLGLSSSRVGQLERAALRKLRRTLTRRARR